MKEVAGRAYLPLTGRLLSLQDLHTCAQGHHRAAHKYWGGGATRQVIAKHLVFTAVKMQPLFLAIWTVLYGTLTTAQIVNLGYAQYQGVVQAAVDATVFYGMRYAAPPTGPYMPIEFRSSMTDTPLTLCRITTMGGTAATSYDSRSPTSQYCSSPVLPGKSRIFGDESV